MDSVRGLNEGFNKYFETVNNSIEEEKASEFVPPVEYGVRKHNSTLAINEGLDRYMNQFLSEDFDEDDVDECGDSDEIEESTEEDGCEDCSDLDEEYLEEGRLWNALKKGVKGVARAAGDTAATAVKKAADSKFVKGARARADSVEKREADGTYDNYDDEQQAEMRKDQVKAKNLPNAEQILKMVKQKDPSLYKNIMSSIKEAVDRGCSQRQCENAVIEAYQKEAESHNRK